MMIIVFVTSSLFNIISSGIYGENCQPTPEDIDKLDANICYKNWVTLFSLGNKLK